MIPLSVLDLIPVREGGTISEALNSAASLARAAEQAGYKRFWVAEHHGMDGIAGGATAAGSGRPSSTPQTKAVGSSR